MVNKITGDTTLSEDSLFKLGYFKINGKKINVPLHVIDLNQIQKSNLNIAKEDVDFNEIFRTYDDSKIRNIHTDGLEYRKEETSIKRIWETANKDKPICIFYRYTGQRYLTEEEIKDIINLYYTYSDLLTIPALPNIFDKKIKKIISKGKRKGQVEEKIDKNPTEEEFNEYLDFLDLYISLIRKRNNKDILGILPLVFAPSKIRVLINFYVERNVNHFYFDFNTRMYQGIDSHFFNFQTELEQMGHEFEKTFIYSLNGSSGKFTKNENVIGAKDILTSGIGIDAVGKLHLGGGSKKPPVTDPRVKMKLLQNKVRLFNKSDYGYYKLGDKIPFEIKDTCLNPESITNVKADKDLLFSKIFNMEQLSKESKHLQEYISENQKPLGKIGSDKGKVDPKDLKKLKSFREKYSKFHRN